MKIRRIYWKFATVLGLAASFGSATAAFAESTSWQGSQESNSRLFAASDATGQLHLALHITLAEGWKTYWRHPGDAGAPPRLIWRGSENVVKLSPKWPVPSRFHAFGYDSFGYSGELVLPFHISIKDPSKPAKIALAMDYLVCANICLPQSAQLKLTVRADSRGGQGDRRLLNRYLALVPKANGPAPINVSKVALQKGKDGEVLVITARTVTIFGKPDVMVEASNGYTFSRPETTYSRDRRTATLKLKVRYRSDDPPSLVGKNLRITIVDDTETVEHRTTVVAGS